MEMTFRGLRTVEEYKREQRAFEELETIEESEVAESSAIVGSIG